MTIRAKLILSVLALSLASLLLWISGMGFLEVTITNPQRQAKYTFVLANKEGRQVEKIQSSSPSFKKLIAKGTYQVLVESGSGSSFSLARTGGFFRTTVISGNLRPESSREFVGNEPNACMFYGQNLLYSYSCNEFGSLTAHLPASETTPTKAVTETGPYYLPISGMVNINGINKAFLSGPQSEVGGNVTALYDISPDLRLSNPTILNWTGPAEGAKIMPFKSGFIVYDETFSAINYFEPESKDGEPVQLQTPSGDTTNPVDISANTDSIGVLFNSNTEGGTDQEVDQLKGKSEVTIYRNSGFESYKFDKLYTSGGLCGKMLCLLNSGVLDIYELRSGKAALLTSMPSIQKTMNLGSAFVIFTKDKILSLDDKMTGYIQFKIKGNKYCGAASSGSGYVFCLNNAKNGKSALYINPEQPGSDNIDNKIYQLAMEPFIDSISIYKKYVFIAPNLGPLVYQTAIDGYGYDPSNRQSINEKIKNKITQLGIDRRAYKIIGTLD